MAESKYLQVTPQYKAMSLDDRMRHVALYKPEYEKQQDAYDKLLENTLILENLKGSDIDADLYRQYSQWRGELVGAAEALSNTGKLDMQSVRDLRRQYFNEFKPMEDKYKHRNTLIATQAAKASPNTIYDRDFSRIAVSDISLDDTVRSLDLAAIEKQAYDDATSRYLDTGLPEDTDPDIERLLEGTDLSGYSEDAKGRVTDSIRKGYYKASNAIDEYKANQEAKDIQLQLSKRNLTRPYSNNGGGRGTSNKETIVDSVTGRKVTVYMKGNELYTDKTYTTKYIPGESSLTNEDKDKYAGLSGTYDYNDILGFTAGASASGSKTSMNSITDYQNFIRGGGSEKAREALTKFISEKKIDPYVMYATGVVFNVYEDDGQYYVEVGKKPATAPPGA